MASITIRDLPDKTKEVLRVRAAQCGVSLESYVRQMLNKASSANGLKPISILDMAEKYFGSKHGVDIELPKRSSGRQPTEFN
jgi:plasmid stability protein